MTAKSEAAAHALKARSFLDQAELSCDLGATDPATSHAVTAGINAKDAICLALTGRTAKGGNHAEAVKQLKAAGPVGVALHANLQRLLSLKSKAQYGADSVTPAQATAAIKWARALVEGAEEAVRRL